VNFNDGGGRDSDGCGLVGELKMSGGGGVKKGLDRRMIG